ncbi:uncharacterized protein CcaverHIS019_0601970 [Cutaneotrichosporon cavernicola]|uniref:DNA repair protein REV1 n=1 Tax=Cutaneotrichosporon cavernicola TaxID=279322 RepID=A0AA48QXV7_9TREE|nr:uncharacterized protein CcaverHIS019_0601970 [Cutaneotrichosporon cavernicola]BEI93738.1 hypothetical protein CcaverHIS019_0601970 [Cutaneotrichosporon cavernicola]BEJ01516.1 hypothetical protein CcaverHIS631_0601980 [Cutaneotrichosporon cavernicola]BEJ09281.1 hypothetical protein CcaverHIS641_0601960 [Cutaneotrichosporon cavernicola]
MSDGPGTSQEFWEEAIALQPTPQVQNVAPDDEGPYAKAGRRRYVLSPDSSDGPSPLHPPSEKAPSSPTSPSRRAPDTTVSVSFLPASIRSGPIEGALSYLAGDEYRPTAFGNIGDYMAKKDVKVQTQNAQLAVASEALGIPQIFKGLTFYINGNTNPSMPVLRRLIVQRGGTVQPYIRTKGSIDYVVAPVLTLAKFKELNKGGRVRIVREGFVTQSVEEGKVVDWRKWRLVAQEEGGLAEFIKATQDKPVVEDEDEKMTIDEPPAASSSHFPMAAPKVAVSGMLARPLVAQQGLLPASPRVFQPQAHRPPGLPTPTPKPIASSSASIPAMEVPRHVANVKHLHQQSSTSSVSGTSAAVDRAENSSQTDFGEMIDLAGVDIAELEGKAAPAPLRIKPVADATAAPADKAPTEAVKVPVTAGGPEAVETEAAEVETTGSDQNQPPAEPEARGDYYALYRSNPHASRLMKTEGFREQMTAASGTSFIDTYYQKSRLHLLSTWKAALKLLVAEARGMAGHVPRVLPPAGAERVFMHVDFDAFFVSVGLATRPQLAGKPAVVCHSSRGGKDSTSEVASASYEARARGVRNGMSLGRARQLCGPELETIPYEFETYKSHSTAFYSVLVGYADELEAVSIDEALLDVTGAVNACALAPDAADADPDPAVTVAKRIRLAIKKKTGCNVSVGISHNILLARLATRNAKPPGPGVFHLMGPDIAPFLSELDVDNFPSFARSAKNKLAEAFGATTVQALLPQSKEALRRVLGPKTGDTLYSFMRGKDDRQLEPDKARKSVSAETNYAIRFADQVEADAYLGNLADEVSKRLKAIGAKGRHVTLKIMARDPNSPVEPPKFLGHGHCETFNKSAPLARHTNDGAMIGAECIKLLHGMLLNPVELRGVGIQVTKLEFSAEVVGGQPTLSFTKLAAKMEEGQRPLSAMLKGAELAKPTTEAKTVPEPSEETEPSPSALVGSPTPPAPPSPVLRGHVSSELDPDLLAALPLELHADARAQYRAERKRQREEPSEPEQEPHPKRPQLNPAAHITRQLRPKTKTQLRAGEVAELPLYTAWGRGGRRSRTGSRAGSRMGTREPESRGGSVPADEVIDVEEAETRELRALGIDPDVFAALPPDVQADVVAQERARRPVVKGGNGKKRVPRAGRAAPVAQAAAKPALFGERSTAGVAGVLASWVNSGPPASRDVERVTSYLRKCLNGLGGVEHVSSLLRSMRALEPGGEWADVWETLRAAVDEGVRERMGAGLRL